MSVVIFSRDIHTGKTTELFEWLTGKYGIAGILMPDVNGSRMFYDIAGKKYFPAAVNAGHTGPTLTAGDFSFDKASFEKANALLEKELGAHHSLIIIDEVGKLEMRDEGFSKSLRMLIEKKADLLIVVRTTLLGAVIEKFGLQQARVIDALGEFDPGIN
jgi:nucleoside-triphosphatase THEP1